MDESLVEDMKIIRQHLETEYDAQAIILSGSRSFGDYKKDSDWDIYILTEKEIKFHPILDGYQLDIYCLHPDDNFSFDKMGWKLFICEVICDTPSGDAQRIVDQAQEFRKKGPELWTLNRAITRRDKVERYANKLRNCIETENWFELHQRLNWHFLENSYSWWYGIKGEWEPRPQQIMEDLTMRDSEFAELLKKIVNSKTTDIERVELFHQLHQNFLNSKVYKDYIKKVSS
ncbi:MAG: nucleotidyltransferase domain-containing protein [Candidatus Heimdallarchaeaceae archaeon]